MSAVSYGPLAVEPIVPSKLQDPLSSLSSSSSVQLPNLHRGGTLQPSGAGSLSYGGGVGVLPRHYAVVGGPRCYSDHHNQLCPQSAVAVSSSSASSSLNHKTAAASAPPPPPQQDSGASKTIGLSSGSLGSESSSSSSTSSPEVASSPPLQIHQQVTQYQRGALKM